MNGKKLAEGGPLQARLRSRATDDSIALHPGQLQQ